MRQMGGLLMGGESTGFDLAGEIWRLTRSMQKWKESEMGITEYLREKARGLGGKRGFSCSKYLADEFGIECGELSCGECYACLFERIADRVEAETDELRGLRDENERLRGMVREPQLPEGVKWPHFEDGGLVGFGDEVEHEGETWKVTGVGFESPGFDIGLRCGLNIGAMSGSYGERVKRPAPKVLDADGVPIKVGDTVWTTYNGCEHVVKAVCSDGSLRPNLLMKDGCMVEHEEGGWDLAKNVTHEQPDSWILWGEDLDMAVKAGEVDKVEMMRRAKALAKAASEAWGVE